jgi:hypothetical protein
MIMRCAFIPGLRELWVSCGTKFGKTISGVAAYCALAPVLNDGIIRHVAPIYTQSRIGMRYASKFLPGEPYTKANYSDHSIKFTDPNKHQILEFWHGQNPESLEGDGVMFYLLDEASKMKQQVYDSARTTMTMTRGLLAATSTPRGKQSWFYVKCMEAKQEMEWCLRKGIPPTKIFITAPTSANPYIHPEEIALNKRNLPDRLYRQYFEAEFIENGEIFPYFKDAIEGDELHFDMESQLWAVDEPGKLETIVIGADWGKKEDYAVFTAWDVKTRSMVGFMRFRGVDYINAIKNLIWFCQQYGNILTVRHDKTGLGEVIDDALSHTELPYEGVIFTNKSKSEMVNKLMLAFQRRDIKIPHWPEMIEELDSYEVKFSEIGNMKYAAGEGFHDDIVSSMFLGWAAVEEYAPSSFEVLSLDDLQDVDLAATDLQAADEDFYEWLGKT